MSPANKQASFVGLVFGQSILLAKRIKYWGKDKIPVPFGGYWSFFGGMIEEGELPIVTAQRELLEESGIYLDLSQIKYFDSVESDVTLHVHFAELNNLIQPQLNEEHTQHGWFNMSALRTFHGKVDEQLLSLIEKYSESKYF